MRRGSQKRLLNIWERYRQLLGSDRTSDHSSFLLGELTQTNNPEERLAIEAELITEFQRNRRYKDAEAILNRHVPLMPKHPFPLISLAEHFHYHNIDRRKAL